MSNAEKFGGKFWRKIFGGKFWREDFGALFTHFNLGAQPLQIAITREALLKGKARYS